MQNLAWFDRREVLLVPLLQSIESQRECFLQAESGLVDQEEDDALEGF